MKKILSLALAILMLISMCALVSCKDKEETMLYTEDVALGNGKTEFTFTVEHMDGKRVVFTIKTDKTTLADALIEHDLLEGEDGPYGIYVKKINGITHDYDKDYTYWALYIGDDYAMTGADATEIENGASYTFKATR